MAQPALLSVPDGTHVAPCGVPVDRHRKHPRSENVRNRLDHTEASVETRYL